VPTRCWGCKPRREILISTASVSAPNSSTSEHDRRWLILAVLSIAQLMVVLDATVVNIALPSAQSDLHFSDSSRQWVVTAYTLGFGSLLLLGGRLSDLFGRRRTLITGLIGFAVASAVAGASESFAILIGARAIQGIFGAILAPAALSLLTTTFTDPKERNTAFGIFGAIAGSGAGIGLLLGGVLTEYLSWRWCLYVNLIFAAIGAAGTVALIVHHPRPRPRLDVVGTATGSASIFALVYGFSEADRTGWGTSTTIGFLAAGVALLIAFVALERRSKDPLLPLWIVADRNRGGSLLAMLLTSVGIFAVFLFVTFYLQQTLGYSPVKSGLAFLPLVGAIILSSTTSSTLLLARFGGRLLIPTGMALAALGMVLFTGLHPNGTYAAHLLPGLVVMGLGLGLVFAPAFNLATQGISSDDSGVGSAAVNTAQQVGGSLGTSLLNTVATTATSNFLVAKTVSAGVVAEATVHGYVTAFWWAAAIFATGAVITAFVLRSGTPALEPAGKPAVEAAPA
jgi:EmrB/QacA subfamily drug resistance transporter